MKLNLDLIENLDNWSYHFRKKLWTLSKDSFSQLSNPKTKLFTRIGLFGGILSLLLSTYLLLNEYLRSDHAIFGKERICAICNDGWVSPSTGSGTCSHHGGVDHWNYPQIGFHYCNVKPYWLAILFSVAFMFLLSIINAAFRRTILACLSEVANGIGYMIFTSIAVTLFFIAIPFFIIAVIYRAIFARKK